MMSFCFECGCNMRIRHKHNNHPFLSSPSLFFLFSFLILASISLLYAWLAFPRYQLRPSSSLGCDQDNEGSWAIGVYYGDSPFALKPIEYRNVWNDESAAWPIANPVVTCATVSDAGFPTSFVANPFLFIQEDAIYLFYETKNSVTLQGDIGVAKSINKGATWEQLGIALDEEWHLSYPYVFKYNHNIYLMPESSQKGELSLYRALDFPMQWMLEKVVMEKPLSGSFIVNRDNMYWLFGSDTQNGKLMIWSSGSPLGSWRPHDQNLVYHSNTSLGVQSGGRPFVYNGSMYRVAQESRGASRGRVRAFKVEVLTKDEYKEVEVPLNIEESEKGQNAWNGARYHHLDVQQLGSNEWIGVVDGDRFHSGNYFRRYVIGYGALSIVVALVFLVGASLGAVKCTFPLHWSYHGLSKRSDTLSTKEQSHVFFSKLLRHSAHLSLICLSLRSWMKLNNRSGKLLLALAVIIGVALMCTGVGYIYGGNGAEEAHLLNGHYSQFTLLAMTYEARLWNLKMYVKHYSRCPSVKEIVVVWNKGEPPALDDLVSSVPVKIRVENQNSLNNRFKVDPLINTRAVLELDDDIMMSCNDIERGFKVWREHPDRIVGYYPRLIQGSPLQYRNERFAQRNKGYNMILTGAAFVDSGLAFQRYWSKEAKAGRELVDKHFNCEDVLLNFLYVNASSSRTVEYVKPGWVIDMSKFSGVAISRNAKVHYQIRSECLREFSELYGSLADQKWKFIS